jgi:hypothetical protein
MVDRTIHLSQRGRYGWLKQKEVSDLDRLRIYDRFFSLALKSLSILELDFS